MSATTAFPRAALIRHWLSHATEPHILYPAIAVIVLGIVWGTTLNLIRGERAAAESAASASAHDQGHTYEAQVLRVLHDIDRTLKFVKYAYERGGDPAVLSELKDRSLLPPDLLFVVTITDANGNAVAGTRPSTMPATADPRSVRAEHWADVLRIDGPRVDPGSGEWRLQFSRGLRAADGRFAGVVRIAVDAAYFVSGYEHAEMGEHGVIAMVGTDGVILARRSGDTVAFGEKVDYASVPLYNGQVGDAATLEANAWDGVRRYTVGHQLAGFPVAVIVGLSEEERLAPSRNARLRYVWWASAGSAVALVILAVLGWMSRELAMGRRRIVAEHVAHGERVEHMAYHDRLTGLPNRSLFSNLLAASIGLAHRNGRRLAVLFLDLDGFKHVNDTLGHEAGDQMLQEVASRLKGCLRESDTVARVGGDEFVALLPDLEDETYVAAVARKVIEGIAGRFVIRGREFRVTASVGISLYPEDGADEEALMKCADTAMYHAKAGGKNGFQFYSARLNAASQERLVLEAGLRHALERNELQLHYHARRDIGSERITGLEALLRWRHHEMGDVSPARFIPVAEETGLIVPIGKWALRTACRQGVAWQHAGLPRLTMAVNLAARQFHDENLVRDLAEILAETGMDARLLELEISESLLLRDVQRALAIVAGLKALGVRIAIDDFGMGYLSLAALRQFPLDTIKIHRPFIRDIAGAPEDTAVARAIIAMARSMSPTVVAQGVETPEQAELLRRNPCVELQGFLFDRPVPADHIAQLLRAQADAEGAEKVKAIRR